MALFGAVLGGYLSSAGGTAISSALQIKEAKKSRQFQERMSSTAYQRSMADMRKAGLNPILAYQKGGASTPGGAQAQIGDFGKAATTALQAATTKAGVANTQAGTANTALEVQRKQFEMPQIELDNLAAKYKLKAAHAAERGAGSALDVLRKGVKDDLSRKGKKITITPPWDMREGETPNTSFQRNWRSLKKRMNKK